VVLAIDGDVAGALLDPNAGDGVFTLAGRVGAAKVVNLALVDALLGCRGVALALQLSQIF